MSFFSEASLAMIPSGYKTSKVYSALPTPGDGDLAFSRTADTATRVGPDGLIEKVRTNHILQSNSFDTTWLPTDATVTSGATDPNGGTTAWTLANTAASGIIQQAVTLTGLRSVSIYAKQGTHRYLRMGAYGGTNSYQNFDLQDGVVSSGANGRIENVGGGWYRCTSFGADGTTGGIQIFPSDSSSGAATTNGNILIWKCQYESGDIATAPITTLGSAVSVGPVANVPRLDYLDSSSPRLLLEPQRTNLVTYSEQFDNAAWNKLGITVAANNTTSPSGYIDADKLIADAGTGNRVVYQGVIPVGVSTTTVYAKAGEFGGIVIASGTQGGFFNLTTGAYRTEYNSAPNAYSITSVGNGWYRCSVTMTSVSGDNLYIGPNDNVSTSLSITSDGTSGIYAWGAQLEAGSYETSYIPTLEAAVTRGADLASKTGISSLIGQTAGTIFVDFVWNGLQSPAAVDAAIFSIGVQEYGTSSIAISNYNGTMYARVTNGVTAEATINFGSLVAGTRYKAALAYANNDVVFYVNGVSYGSDTSASIPATGDVNFQNAYPNAKSVNQAILFPTRLQNSDLAALTA